MAREGSPSGGSDLRSSDGVPSEGDVIASKYKVERVLGAGGMGIVVAARHLQLGQRVAIKFIRGEAAADRNALERFLREARAAAALSSEHVAKVLDVGTLETGAPFMVMEYLDGIDLSERLRRSGPMAVADATSAVLQASEAIAEAHSRGIVHRDLKPSNLFVTKSVDGGPLVKVLDFGISKMTEASSTDGGQNLTASGTVMGSPGYMSPEQVRSAKEVDPRSDIWALGVILYELLSGVQPFRGTTMGETFARILTESPAPIRSLRADLPQGLANAIAQCLQRDREKRPQGVGELAAKLLPFAPPDGRRSVERILRVSGVPGDVAVRQETLAADGGLAGSDELFEPVETGRAWLRSGSVPPSPSRRVRGAVVIAAAGFVASGAAAGLYMMKGRATNVVAGSSVVPSAASSLASAPSAKPAWTLAGTETTLPPAASGAIAFESADAGPSHPTSPVHLVPPGQPAKTASPKRPPPNPSATPVTHERDVF